MEKNRLRNKYEIIGDIVNIYMRKRTTGEVFITTINTCDLYKLEAYDVTFYPDWDNHTQGYYAYATQYLGMIDGKPKYKRPALHAIIAGDNNGLGVDHINHNTLDNTRKNLEIRMGNSNAINRKGANKNGTSGYRNVSLIRGFWRVQLQVDGKNKLFPEKFEDAVEADSFAKEMRKLYYEV